MRTESRNRLGLTGPTMIYLATTLPGLLLVAEIARRMARLLRAAQDSDPFTMQTARELTVVAKITALGGLGSHSPRLGGIRGDSTEAGRSIR